jgi:hypothetical protein
MLSDLKYRTLQKDCLLLGSWGIEVQFLAVLNIFLFLELSECLGLFLCGRAAGK